MTAPGLPRRTLLALAAMAPAIRPARAEPPPHPRLFLTPERARQAGAALVADAQGQAIRQAVLQAATKLLDQPVLERRFEARRPVMLPTSRAALERVQALGIAHALTGEARFAERGAAEVLNLCAFPDWNPSHFLDVAEAAHAAALGYDWFQPALGAAGTARVRQALVEKALLPAERDFAARRFWTQVTHNWNIVCCGGIGVAALALLGEEPRAAPLLARCLEAAKSGFSSFHQDGAWAEGPGYWEYATAYAVYLLAALESAGQALPPALAQQPGFTRTGGFLAHMTGPTGRVFNFGDGGPGIRRPAQLGWLARQYGRPQDAWTLQRRPGTPTPLEALWHAGPAPTPGPTAAAFPDAAIASFRGAWGEGRATWLAIKGGDNAANHGDLDLGTFVLEAGGQRFGAELGADDYALPGYFGRERYGYMRTATRGQNVLQREGQDQARQARAPLLGFRDEPGFARAVFEVSAAYPGLAHRRGGGLVEGAHAVLADEWQATAPVPLSWQMLTQAEIAIDGPLARLSLGGAVLEARLVEAPPGAAFGIGDAAAPPPENPNTGFRKLLVRWGEGAAGRLVVLFSPAGTAPPRGQNWRKALAEWT